MMTNTTIETGRFEKRVALLKPENGGSTLFKTIEKIILDGISLGNYTTALISINVEVHMKFGVNFIMTRQIKDEVFWQFAKDFGEISPIVAAMVELHEDEFNL